MRASSSLSLLLAAAGTQVAAQSVVSTETTVTLTSTTSAAASSTVSPDSTTGKLGDATVVTNNPAGVVYKAKLPESAFFKPAFPDGGNIKGEISAVANTDGKGVLFTVKLSNLPKFDAPLSYHIHVEPVPEDGNCTSTLAHLDPFIRGETPACNKDAPATCQVGDLSGKHGTIPANNQNTFETSYVDYFASTVEGIGAFFGNRSIVIHYPNKTRITCASFAKVAPGSASLPTTASTTGGGYAAPTGGVSPTTTGGPGRTSPSPVTAAASGLRAGAASAVLFGAVAAFLL